MSEIKRLARNYEISVWTLQDSFITVLGSLNGKYRGRIQNPEMKLVNDGTQEFDFSIPMYLDNGIDRIINPTWQDINNAQVIMGMRKIKIIFNKATDVEKVFEFIITKVIKVHDNDKPQCDVHCEGLAFHELGKIGYKIEFSTDELSEESYQWYKDKTGEEPVPTIDYWCQKKLQLEKLPSNASLIDSKKWYYKVDMDWSDYAHASDIPRANDKIYEEEFAVAWTDDLLPKNSSSVTSYKEKTRILDEKESNIYNLTQKLAETFGVFCRYDYGYDDNYHIVSRTVVFYNNGVKDGARKLSFTYPYSSTKISREDDCIDIVTKMYVSAIEDQTTDSGLISIMSSDANPTKEDYLMNFDYLHEIGTITDEQYNYITTYERNIAAINTSLAQIQDQLLVKEDRLPKVEALHTTAVNAAALDSERMNNAKRLCDELTNRTGVIVVSGANAKPAILQNQIQDGSLLFFNAPDNGILSETLQIYTTFNGGTLSGALNKNVGSKVYDEFGNLTKVENISVSVLNGSSRRQIYLTYSYHPKLYWEKIQKVWASRLAKDEAEAATYQSEITTLKSEIEALKTQRTTLLDSKAAEIKKFEELMGPALREGYWTPDNYNVNTGEKYTDYITISATNLATAGGESGHTSFLWDKEMFDDEQKGTYQIGINQSEKSYPCIILNSSQIAFMADPNNADKPIGVLYYDYTASAAVAHEPSNMQCLALGAGAKLTVVYSSSNGAQLALLLTGASSFDDDKINFIKSNAAEARIGYLTTETVSGTLRVVDKPSTPLTISNNQWVSLSSSLYVVYPRCKIDSLTLKNNETDLNVSYNNNLLTEFEDYYVFQRVDNDNSTITSNYYITLKPEVFLTSGALNLQLAVRFCLSNSSTSIYLDAREVLKENSKPKVTYSVDPNVFYEEFIYTDYNALNVIAFINDYQLQFDGAQGYISSLSLNLDFPNQDRIEIKNYKNKFEDLFSTIVAQTEAMEKNESVLTAASKAFNTDGSLTTSLLTGALKKVDLNYAFNNGKLTISEKDGIWGISDSGVVAYRGGGIFTATRKDEAGNWIWNTGIVPEGINADLITSGQLDTARIKVYAGDRLRFQLNGDGLFAYKSFYSDYETGATGTALTRLNTLTSNSDTGIDYSQYVVLNEEGLFLTAKKGAYVLNDAKSDYIVVLNGNSEYSEIRRVSIDWEGLTLRNWNNQTTFFANANNGDLFISGTLKASAIYVQDNDSQWNSGVKGTVLSTWYDNRFESDTLISANLKAIFQEAAQVITDANATLTGYHTVSTANATILNDYATEIKNNLKVKQTTGATPPDTFKPGDIWAPASGTYAGHKYIATSYSGASSVTASDPLRGWNRTYNGSLASIKGAGIAIDTVAGTIDITAASTLTLSAKMEMSLSSNSIQITGNKYVNIGAAQVNIGASTDVNIITSDIGSSETTDQTSNSVVKISKTGIKLGTYGGTTAGIDIVTGGPTSTSVIKMNNTSGIWLGSSQKITLTTSDTENNNNSNVELTPGHILFGVSNTTSGTMAVELTDAQLIMGAGDKMSSLQSNDPSTSLAGIKIKKDGIWLSTVSNNVYNLISLTHNGIQLGVVPSKGNGGTYIKLTKNQADMVTGGSADSRIYLGTYNFDHKGDGSYVLINQSGVDAKSGSTAVHVGTNAISLTSGNTTAVTIGVDQISLASGKITINNEPVWERNDIIYAPTPEAVRALNPPNDRQWLWVQPIGFNTVIFSDDGGSLKSQDGAVLNSSDNMQYKVTMECYFTGLNAGLGNDITLSISNSDNNVSWNMRWYGVQFEAGAGRTGSRTLTDTWNTTNIQENLCSVASISWSADAPGASYTLHVSSVVLEAKSATGTGAWSECKVYYFPAGTYPYDPTAIA